MSIWTWLYKFSRKKIRKDHLSSHGGDIKCPCCNEWFSVSGVDYKHESISQPDFGYHLKCGKCGHESYWNAVAAPVLLLCKDSGDPI